MKIDNSNDKSNECCVYLYTWTSRERPKSVILRSLSFAMSTLRQAKSRWTIFKLDRYSWREGGRQGGEGGMEEGREGGMEGGREGGRDGGREGGREGWREAGREAGMEGGREAGRGGRDGGREGGREGREGGREGGREAGRDGRIYMYMARQRYVYTQSSQKNKT